jgi:hypothetical protein
MRRFVVLFVPIVLASACVPAQSESGLHTGVIAPPIPSPFPPIFDAAKFFRRNDGSGVGSPATPTDRPSYPRVPYQVGSRRGIFVVSSELQLTRDQEKKIARWLDRLGKEGLKHLKEVRHLPRSEGRMRTAKWLAERDSQLAAILTADQHNRYRQLRLQQGGLSSLNQEAVADELQLTDEQRARVLAILQEETTAVRASTRYGEGGKETFMAQMEVVRNRADERIAQLLTENQKSRWKEMLGAPFIFSTSRLGR